MALPTDVPSIARWDPACSMKVEYRNILPGESPPVLDDVEASGLAGLAPPERSRGNISLAGIHGCGLTGMPVAWIPPPADALLLASAHA